MSDSATPWTVPPGSSVHGISQARILEWVALLFSRRSSWTRDWTLVYFNAGRFFIVWATREGPHYKPATQADTLVSFLDSSLNLISNLSENPADSIFKIWIFFCKNLAISHHLNHYLRYCPMSRSFLEHLCQISAPFPGQHLLHMHVYPIPIQHHRRESILLSFHICHSLIRQWITWLLTSSYKRGLRDQIKRMEKSGNEVSSWPKMIQSFYIWKLCNKVLSVRGALMTQYYNLLLNALVCVISFGKCS